MINKILSVLRTEHFLRAKKLCVLLNFLLIFILISSRIISVAQGGNDMSEITRVALDAMGGDNAPREMVKGAVEAVRKRKDIKVLLTGKRKM